MVQIRPPKTRTDAAKESRVKHYVNRLPEEAQGQQMGVDAAGSAMADARWLGGQKNAKGGWYMGQETNAALRRKLRTQRAAYEELLGLAGAIMAALIMAVIPVIIFYLACQKYIIEGVAAGAVKG